MRFLVIFLAASGSSSPPTVSNTGGSGSPSGPLDCGTVTPDTDPASADSIQQCFVDAFAAGDAATVLRWTVSDEGGRIDISYRFDGTTLERTIDDRDDQFSGDPGVHVSRCTSIRIDGGWLVADCTP